MFHSLQTFVLPGTSSNGFSVWQRGQAEGSEPQLHGPHYKPHVRFTFLRLLSAAAATRSVSSAFRRTLQHVFFKLVGITSLQCQGVLCNRLQSRKHNVELYNLPPGGRTQSRVGCFFVFFCSSALDVKLSQAYQYSLQTDVSAFSSLFKLTNQCARHRCNYGKNRNQPSWSSVCLSQTNQRPLPRSPVLMSCAACERSPKIAEFFPRRAKSSRRPTSCPEQLFATSVTTRLPRRVMVGLCCAVQCGATHRTRALLCSARKIWKRGRRER